MWASSPTDALSKVRWAGRRGRRPLRVVTRSAVRRPLSHGFAVTACPPSCQPIPGHYRGRQSGHFLEIASLLPPLAALRRFPLAQGSLWTGVTDCHGQCAHWPRNDRFLHGSAVGRAVEDAGPYGMLQGVRRLSGGGVRAPRPTKGQGGRR